MANFKRHRQISKTSRHCSICGSQRRLFGWGSMKVKKLMSIFKKEERNND